MSKEAAEGGVYLLKQQSPHILLATQMALNSSHHQMLYRTTAGGAPCSDARLRCAFLIPSSSTPSWSHPRTHYHHKHHHHHQLTVVSASKRSSSSPRTGKFDSKNRRTSISTKEDGEEEKESEQASEINFSDATGTAEAAVDVDDGFVMPQLPGDKPDFWEGPQWDGFGFFVQYLWAFGIVFALISSGIAVATYNEGATDFKETPAYKESVQSRELLEEPEASNSDVFESNPTEEAPSLE